MLLLQLLLPLLLLSLRLPFKQSTGGPGTSADINSIAFDGRLFRDGKSCVHHSLVLFQPEIVRNWLSRFGGLASQAAGENRDGIIGVGLLAHSVVPFVTIDNPASYLLVRRDESAKALQDGNVKAVRPTPCLVTWSTRRGQVQIKMRFEKDDLLQYETG